MLELGRACSCYRITAGICWTSLSTSLHELGEKEIISEDQMATGSCFIPTLMV